MAFVKHGDATPIVDYLDSNVKPRYCPECGKKLKIIALAEEIKLVCDCEKEEQEELN